jgi:acyl-CoA thioesterase YciA
MCDDVPDLAQGPSLRTVATPADANPSGDIFGGWIVSQMDLAGAIVAAQRARGRVVRVGIEAMKFHLPVLVGDEVSCYPRVIRVGRTSVAVRVDTWARRSRTGEGVKVTEGTFTYVAIDAQRRPKPLLPEQG